MTQSDLQSLFSRPERLQPSVLSVYLNVDQSRQANLNRGFETRLRELISSIRTTIHDAPELDRFASAAHHITDFVSAYEPHARGLAVFFDTVDGFFWHREMDVTLHTHARWDREFFSQPLANALDQFERYGVVLVDRTCMRLFSVFLDEIEEFPRVQADEQVRIDLQDVIRAVDTLVQTKQTHRLILAGPFEITSELRDLLPKRLSLRVIGVVDIRADAALRDVLAATRRLAEAYERSTEVQTVKEVVTAAEKHQNALIGLGETLKAVNSGRIWQLIYVEGFAVPGFECSRCSALFSVEHPSCLYCGAAIRPVYDVVERAVEHATRNGGQIEVVTGDAARSLTAAGSIGAFLRTRTGSLRA